MSVLHPFTRGNAPLHVAFYRGRDHGNWLDRAIARHDDGLYSHVELVFGPRPRIGRARCFSSSYRDGGVRFKSIALGGGPARKWDLLLLTPPVADVLSLDFWCKSKVGGNYDVPGVLAFKLPFVRERLGWWFCSEIVAAGLQRLGHLPGERPASLSPNKLYRKLRKEGRCLPA